MTFSHLLQYAWLYNAESSSNEKQETSLALPSIARQAVEDKKPAIVNTWRYNAKNSIMYVPEGAPLTSAERMKLALDKDHIVHSSTSFQANPFDESHSLEAVRQAARAQSNARSTGHVDVDGKEIKGPDVPSVNGFAFMKTPSPAPGVNESPLMTWGEIEGTPFRLDGSDTPLPSSLSASPSFHIQQVSERDRIGMKLAEKVGQAYRNRRGRARAAELRNAAHASSSSSSSKRSGTIR